MALPTLLDIATAAGNDKAAALIDEAARVHPEIALFPVRPTKGISYPTRVRIKNPTGGFRAANAGVDYSKGRYENRIVTCHILNPRWQCDKAVADSDDRGAEAFIAEEAVGIVNAGFGAVTSQIYYGSDSNGFPPLSRSVLADRIVDAGGTTANTASSVWAVSFGPTGAMLALGNGGMLDISDVRVETIKGDNDKELTGYVQEMLARIGLQVGNLNGLAGIRNLTEDAGKGLTDGLLGKMLSKMPVGYKPDAIFLTRRSLEQLRASRTATNATGAEAPTPTTFEQIPLVATDSLVDTEALV